MEKLDDDRISAGLQGRRWERDGDAIATTRTFEDFTGSMQFVNAVALLAEGQNHHPDITISWNRVTLTLSTHSEGGITQKDLDLAAAVDDLPDPGR